MCAVCGGVAERPGAGDEPERGDGDAGGDELVAPLGWMVDRDPRTGRVTTICAECARRHARSIEGKLDQAWW